MSTGATTRVVSSRETAKLVGKFDRYLKRSGDVLVDRYGEETAAVMRKEMLDEYRRLIPDVPYIGGWRNGHSSTLSFSAWALAMYRVVVRHGGSLEDTGELLHGTAQAIAERIPRVVRDAFGRYRFTTLNRWQEQRAARKSQARRYPGDWVFEQIDGDGETFDFGVTQPSAATSSTSTPRKPTNSPPISATSTICLSRRWDTDFNGPRPWPGAATDATSGTPSMG